MENIALKQPESQGLVMDGPGPANPIQGIDWSKPVQTKGSGRPVHIYAIDFRLRKPFIGRIDSDYLGDEVQSWRSDGSFLLNGPASSLDLENVPETQEVR